MNHLLLLQSEGKLRILKKIKRGITCHFVPYLVLFLSLITLYSCSDSGGTSPNPDFVPDIEEPETEDTPSAPELSVVVDSVFAEYDIPAMGAAIVTLDKGFTIGVAGERRINSGVSVEVSDRWSWGSNTKAITGFVTAKAVDMGLIEWDQTLEELFPEYLDLMREEYRSVTISDLLTHGSGFVNTSVPGVDGQPLGNGVTPTTQRIKMFEWVIQQPPHNAKGEYYYSNLGFSTIGAILERAFEMPYEKWVIENLADYLELENFGYGPHAEAGSNSQPVPHRLTDSEWIVWEAHENTPFRRPSGGGFGSLDDWSKILAEMMKAENGMSDYITPEAANMLSSIKTDIPGGSSQYSFGCIHVGARDWAEGEAWTHAGSNGANYSIAWVGPEAGVAFLVVINARDTEGITNNATNAMVLELIDYWQEWIR